MKIYTRRGDRGETDLFGGPRVAKVHLRVEAYGAVDELNAALGAARADTAHEDIRDLVRSIQAALLDLGAYLSSPDAERPKTSGVREPSAAEVDALEEIKQGYERSRLFPGTKDGLNGGCPHAAHGSQTKPDLALADDRELPS